MKLNLLCVLLLSLVFVVVAQTTTTTPTNGNVLSADYLFGIMVTGLIVFWRWITRQMDDLKGDVKAVNDKLDKERDEQDARMDKMFDRLYAKLEKRIETERIPRENIPTIST